MDLFIGQIIIVSFNFAPKGYALCNGQLLSLSQNQALYSLLGTKYGGDGVNNFGLPDLRSRAPMGMGSGPGLTPRILGRNGGTESFTLAPNQLPLHRHSLNARNATGAQNTPVGNALAGESTVQTAIYSASALNVALNVSSIGSSDVTRGRSVDRMPPYLTLNFAIALQGVFPSRP